MVLRVWDIIFGAIFDNSNGKHMWLTYLNVSVCVYACMCGFLHVHVCVYASDCVCVCMC